METTTISSKFQVVLPKRTREQLGLKPGMRLTVLAKGDVLFLVPERPMAAYRGIAKGTQQRGLRDKKDRF
jgi:AbrB family looped-hinge helix DNA binding protein